MWSTSGQSNLAGKVLSGRNPSLEEATPKMHHELKRKEDALSVRGEATAVGDQKVKLPSDCKKYGGEAKIKDYALLLTLTFMNPNFKGMTMLKQTTRTTLLKLRKNTGSKSMLKRRV